MPNSVLQTPGTQANKKILKNIKKAKALGNAFLDSQFNHPSRHLSAQS